MAGLRGWRVGLRPAWPGTEPSTEPAPVHQDPSAQDTPLWGQGFAGRESGGAGSPHPAQTAGESSGACPVGWLFFSCRGLLSPMWGDRAEPRDCPFPGVASGLHSITQKQRPCREGAGGVHGSRVGRCQAHLQTPSLTVLRRPAQRLDLPRVPTPYFPCGGPAVQPQGWRTWEDRGAPGRRGVGPVGRAASRVTAATVPTVLALDVFDTFNFTGAWVPRFEDIREDFPRELASSVFFPADFFKPPERRGKAPWRPRAALGGSCPWGGSPEGPHR